MASHPTEDLLDLGEGGGGEGLPHPPFSSHDSHHPAVEQDLLGLGGDNDDGPPSPSSDDDSSNFGAFSGIDPDDVNAEAEEEEEEEDDDDLGDDGLFEPFPTRADEDDDDEGEAKNNDSGGGEAAVGGYTSFAEIDQSDDDARNYDPRSTTEMDDNLLRPGDHVYVWHGTRQRHGIVLSLGSDGGDGGDDDDDDDVGDGGGGGEIEAIDPTTATPTQIEAVTVVSFYNRENRDREATDVAPSSSDINDASYGHISLSAVDDWENADESLIANDGTTTVRAPTHADVSASAAAVSLKSFAKSLTTARKVRKVRYSAGLAKRVLSRPGSVTACPSDVSGLVLARARYLLTHPSSLPDYHRLSANSECAAVWCKLGRYVTLQGSSILAVMFAGQAGGAVVGGAVASNVMLWTPMPGMWGAVGWWWYVPATVAYPILVPILVTFGLASLLPLEMLRRYRKKWKGCTERLNHDFWSKAEEETKVEYFATTATADEDWVRKFFGVKEEQGGGGDGDGGGGGQYMPLDGEGVGGVDDDEDDEDDMARRFEESQAAAYRREMEGGGAEDSNQLKRQMSGLVSRWNRSWTNRRGSGSDGKLMEEAARGNGLGGGGGGAYRDDDDGIAPLTQQEGTTASQQQRPGMMQKWRDSWRGSGSSNSELQMGNGGGGGGAFGNNDSGLLGGDDDDAATQPGFMT